MKVHNAFRQVIACIRQGTVGTELREVFFPNGTPLPKECALWDYKESFSHDRLGYAELAKDILSFFNSYGGYLFFGVAEQKKNEYFDIVGFQRLPDLLIGVRAALDAYSSTRIEVVISDITVADKTITHIF